MENMNWPFWFSKGRDRQFNVTYSSYRVVFILIQWTLSS